jgi:L-amino acid N-acyltransferase YncA
VLIRHADPERDASGCLAIYGPFANDTPISFEESAPTLDEFKQRIERTARTHAYLVAEDEGEIAGFAYAGSHRDRPAYRWSAEVSVYLGERHRGQGLARKLYEVLFPLLEQQGYRILLAGVTTTNPTSIRLHETLGFQAVGVYRRIGWKAGSWLDVMWLSLQLGADTHEAQQPQSPGPPVRLSGPIEL